MRAACASVFRLRVDFRARSRATFLDTFVGTFLGRFLGELTRAERLQNGRAGAELSVNNDDPSS
ncbi:MAG: hypothetical protein DPW22_09660 [Alphaproteobacteria bacterium]|nr:hypothetical protein [Alphaproteobacteria bacterium]